MAEAPQGSKALIAGIAAGLGVAIAGRFAKAGFDVIGLARSARAAQAAGAAVVECGRSYEHVTCDLADPQQVRSALAPQAGDIEIAVYNAHQLLIAPFGETSGEDFERVWRAGCFGAMTVAQCVLGEMAERGSGTVIFTGATAGVRGGARFAAFASAKFALRGLSQSLAREFGPLGVHVCHVVLDGLIDEPQTSDRFGPMQSPAQRMDPDAVAQLYCDLAAQPRSTWTQEVDLRPYSEAF